jgi:hypothetical protein
MLCPSMRRPLASREGPRNAESPRGLIAVAAHVRHDHFPVLHYKARLVCARIPGAVPYNHRLVAFRREATEVGQIAVRLRVRLA